MLNREYLENQKMLGENRLPARTMLVPAQKVGVTHENCLESDRMLCLDGDWKFLYLERDTVEKYWSPALDDSAWDVLRVPSMWQYHGYGSCLYPNVAYPFPYDPPHIHAKNPVGVYRRRFSVTGSHERTLLRFLGVDNAYFVYLNGQYVGFSKGSRIASEFDATPYLVPGENLLTVKVYTYSDASYLENQDMLLASGIFRSVYLVFEGKTSLWDYTLLPEKDGFAVDTVVRGETGAALRVTVSAPTGEPVCEVTRDAAENDSFFLPIDSPHLWNAEDPYLYTLVFTLEKEGKILEVHTKKAGIRFTRTEGNKLLVNDRPIYLKGINRHDNDPHEGKAIDAARIRAELTDIKEHNLNAIRTSHYLQQPVFYEIASELGIYVMDETDAESHGAHVSGDQGKLNKDPEWFDAFFDRTSRMYFLNKNETCINIWSLGNECGDGDNYAKNANWLRSQKILKPITANGGGFGDSFIGTGYMTLEALAAFPDAKKPVLMIEYGHAMGNSPGGLADIWEYVYTHEEVCGGYAWEFKNHGFYEKGKRGRARYLYGGDFKEDQYHWSNFSLDGYHTSDGTPKPSWEELKEVSAPVFVKRTGDGVTVYNTYDFTDLGGTVMHWTILADGKPCREGKTVLSALPPHGHRDYPLDLSVDDPFAFCSLDLRFVRDGKRIAHKCFVLRDQLPRETAYPAFVYDVRQAPDESVTVTGDGFSLCFEDGLICRYSVGGKELFDAPMRPNFWRAPTDNDGVIGLFPRKAAEWREALLHTVRFCVADLRIDRTPDAVILTYSGKFLPQSRGWGIDASMTYTVRAGGLVQVRMTGKPLGGLPETLPRIGMALTLTGEKDRVKWCGRGPGDSYSDRHDATHFGVFSDRVGRMNFLYDVPQETGNREDTLRVSVTDAGGVGVSVFGDPAAPARFAFSCHDFDQEDLTAARHRDELEKDGKIHLYVDYKMRGLGSNSCGPDPEEPYELRPTAFDFRFCLNAAK